MPIPFNEEIKALRGTAELTQAQAAEKCDVSTRSYLDWERGKIVPMLPVRIGVVSILKSSKQKQ